MFMLYSVNKDVPKHEYFCAFLGRSEGWSLTDIFVQL